MYGRRWPQSAWVDSAARAGLARSTERHRRLTPRRPRCPRACVSRLPSAHDHGYVFPVSARLRVARWLARARTSS